MASGFPVNPFNLNHGVHQPNSWLISTKPLPPTQEHPFRLGTLGNFSVEIGKIIQHHFHPDDLCPLDLNPEAIDLFHQLRDLEWSSAAEVIIQRSPKSQCEALLRLAKNSHLLEMIFHDIQDIRETMFARLAYYVKIEKHSSEDQMNVHDFVKGLTEAGCNLNSFLTLDEEDGPTHVLELCLTEDQPQLLEALIRQGADIHFKDENANNLVEIASQNEAYQSLAVMQQLTRNPTGENDFYASLAGVIFINLFTAPPEILKFIEQCPATQNIQSSVDKISWLLSQNKEHSQSLAKRFPCELTQACLFQKNYHLLEHFIEQGLKLDLDDKESLDLITYIIQEKSCAKALKLFIRHVDYKPEDFFIIIRKTIHLGNLDVLNELLSATSLNSLIQTMQAYESKTDNMWYWLAHSKGDGNFIKNMAYLLINAKYPHDSNTQETEGILRTCLYEACRSENPAVLNKLVPIMLDDLKVSPHRHIKQTIDYLDAKLRAVMYNECPADALHFARADLYERLLTIQRNMYA